MSWSFSVGPVKRSEARERLLVASGQAYFPDETKVEAAEQVNAAIDAALALIAKGVVGNPDEESFYISLSGHATPGHEATSGWANDCVTIYISQADRPADSAAKE